MSRTAHTEEQQSNLDDYGYLLPLSTYRKLRTIGVSACRRIVGKCIYLVMSLLGSLFWLARWGKQYPPLTPHSFHPEHILVIRMDLIGDLVHTLPVVRALKRTYPHAEIDLLAAPTSAKVAIHDPHFAEIITYNPGVWWYPKGLLQPKNWRDAQALLRRLHARHYDLAVSVFGLPTAVLAVLSGARRRVGFGCETYPGFMTDIAPGGIPARWRHSDPLDNKHSIDLCLELAQAAGATITPDDRIPHLEVDTQSQQEIAQMLHQEGVEPNKPLIACHISSNLGHAKRWPLPYWATLLDRLICEANAQIVLTGISSDLPVIEDVIGRMCCLEASACLHPLINMAGKTTLPQLVALLHRADLLISGDSGPIHMASALGTPIIGIYGPTNPLLSGPMSPDDIVLRSPIWCSPCYGARASADCRFYTTQCMKDIMPTEVFAAVQNKLKDNSPVR